MQHDRPGGIGLLRHIADHLSISRRVGRLPVGRTAGVWFAFRFGVKIKRSPDRSSAGTELRSRVGISRSRTPASGAVTGRPVSPAIRRTKRLSRSNQGGTNHGAFSDSKREARGVPLRRRITAQARDPAPACRGVGRDHRRRSRGGLLRRRINHGRSPAFGRERKWTPRRAEIVRACPGRRATRRVPVWCGDS